MHTNSVEIASSAENEDKSITLRKKFYKVSEVPKYLQFFFRYFLFVSDISASTYFTSTGFNFLKNPKKIPSKSKYVTWID